MHRHGLYRVFAAGVAWSVGLSVSWSVKVVSPARMAELIEMLFGLRTRVGPRNAVLDGVHFYGSYQLSHVWDKLLHTDDRHRKSVLMKASDVKPKRR